MQLLTYNGHTLEEVAADVKTLNSIARHMRARRYDNGVLSIQKPKLSFTFGARCASPRQRLTPRCADAGTEPSRFWPEGGTTTSDTDGRPVDCSVYAIKESNQLVEEFMLMANELVATKIFASFPEHALLRRHPDPEPRGLATFVQRAQQLGLTVDVSTSKAFQVRSMCGGRGRCKGPCVGDRPCSPCARVRGRTLACVGAAGRGAAGDQASLLAIADPSQRTVMNYLASVPMRPAVYYSTGDHGALVLPNPQGAITLLHALRRRAAVDVATSNL